MFKIQILEYNSGPRKGQHGLVITLTTGGHGFFQRLYFIDWGPPPIRKGTVPALVLQTSLAGTEPRTTLVFTLETRHSLPNTQELEEYARRMSVMLDWVRLCCGPVTVSSSHESSSVFSQLFTHMVGECFYHEEGGASQPFDVIARTQFWIEFTLATLLTKPRHYEVPFNHELVLGPHLEVLACRPLRGL